MIKSIEER